MKRMTRLLLVGVLLVVGGLLVLAGGSILRLFTNAPTPLYVVVTNTPTPLQIVVTDTPTQAPAPTPLPSDPCRYPHPGAADAYSDGG